MSAGLDPVALCEVQAALRGGASTGEAVASITGGGALQRIALQARLGRPLADIATTERMDHPAADFLLRCLALSETTGTGATTAVSHALTAIRDRLRLDRLVDARTTQARGSALVLAVLPLAVWTLLVALDPSALRFYATPPGWLSGGLAVLLATAGWRWMRRMIGRIGHAGREADPLGADPGAAEILDLVAVALEAGLSVPAAFAEAAGVAPQPAAPLLEAAANRLRDGWRCDEALADTPLAPAGRAVAAAQRWGAPAAPTLRDLAEQLRDDRRAAVDVASERLQLALVFPTTLLTLPAFVVGVVPPLLWSTLR